MPSKRIKNKMAPVRLIVFSFITIIIIGTLLLMCPFSASSGESTDFIDALFTATSATCVTGLAVFDTASYWSTAGKCVILVLIQIGGLGAMTLITSLMIFIKKRVSLHNAQILMQSAGNDDRSGLPKLVRRIFTGTAIFETAGAVLLATQFIPLFGWKTGIFYAVFHSVSAFCNAGFDIMGNYNGGASLSAFVDNPVVNLTVIALVVIGGLGFIVWNDLLETRFKVKEFKFHTKLVLVITGVLLLGSFGLFLLFEHDHAFADLTWGDKLLAALFQAVTPRTAGFATVDMSTLSDSGTVLTMVLMLIGGSPGSTAGGIKTTTLAVIFISTAAAVARSTPKAFHRRIDDETVRQAGAIANIYITGTIIATMIICLVENLPLKEALFEVISAIGTVGLSMGVTPGLGNIAKVVLTLFMFAGRIGGFSLVLALSNNQAPPPVRQPVGKVLIG
ncbi:MAG: TrkH family potassium uptake protein [Oscillospiraceae bacterium]